MGNNGTMTPFEGLFGVFFIVVAVLVGVGFISVIALTVRNGRRIRKSGHNPLTLQTDLAVRALDSEMLSPRRSVEERLAELDELHAKGSISASELAAARAKVLGGG